MCPTMQLLCLPPLPPLSFEHLTSRYHYTISVIKRRRRRNAIQGPSIATGRTALYESARILFNHRPSTFYCPGGRCLLRKKKILRHATISFPLSPDVCCYYPTNSFQVLGLVGVLTTNWLSEPLIGRVARLVPPPTQ